MSNYTSRGLCPSYSFINRHNKSGQSGFTLLEILVVLVLVGIGISLVTSELSGAYGKINAFAEEQKFLDLIDALQMRAFLRGEASTIDMKDQTLSFNEKGSSVNFDHISFPETTISFNGNGYPDKDSFSYFILGKEKVCEIY